MKSILIRDLPEQTLENLKRLAEYHHRSLQGERLTMLQFLYLLNFPVKEYTGINGKRIHDINIVATILNHHIENLLTFNPGDFIGIGNINIQVPE